MYAPRKKIDFYNMLLAAKYAPRKNLEKMHRREIRATKCSNFIENGSNLAKSVL